MGAIENFLRRWGYAKPNRYGLLLTPEGRVMSTRPSVLDDGLGGRIVGWQDGDLAAMELGHWDEIGKAPARIAPPPPLPRPPVKASTPKAPPPPRADVAPVAQRVAPVIALAPAVAAEPQVDEDEWEWEIAMARARAAEEAVEDARVDLLGAQAVIAAAVITRKTTPGIAVQPTPDPMPAWPKTEPFNEQYTKEYEAVPPQVLSPLQKTMLVEKKTVIPVPQLPTVSDSRAFRPVTSSPSPPRVARSLAPSQPPRRYARGTARQQGADGDTVRTPMVAGEDKTSPYIELPSEVKPSGFAHTKRVAAKQR